MSIVDFIAVASFGLTCFGLGYSFGKDNSKTQKQPPRPDKLSDYFQLIDLMGQPSIGGSLFVYSIYHVLVENTTEKSRYPYPMAKRFIPKG